MRSGGGGVVGQGGDGDEIVGVSGFDVGAGEGVEGFRCLPCDEVIDSAGIEVLVLAVEAFIFVELSLFMQLFDQLSAVIAVDGDKMRHILSLPIFFKFPEKVVGQFTVLMFAINHLGSMILSSLRSAKILLHFDLLLIDDEFFLAFLFEDEVEVLVHFLVEVGRCEFYFLFLFAVGDGVVDLVGDGVGFGGSGGLRGEGLSFWVLFWGSGGAVGGGAGSGGLAAEHFDASDGLLGLFFSLVDYKSG